MASTREVNWSDFQNRQLDALKNINKSFTDSLKISANMSKSLDYTAKVLTAIATRIVPSLNDNAAQFADKMKLFNQYMHTTNFKISDFALSLDNATQATRRRSRYEERHAQREQEAAEATELFTKAAEGAIRVLKNIAEGADKFSNTSNELIRITGLSGRTISNFRGNIEKVVTSLNSQFGSARLNYQESYDSIKSVASAVTGDIDALQEMSRPLLLANKAMSTDINTMAKLFNKLYVRYNFSSATMETLVSDIRKYSADNSATSDDMIAAQNQLHDIMLEKSGGDSSKYTQMSANLDKFIGFLSSKGVDNPTSVVATLFENIANGNLSELEKLLPTLNAGGLGADINSLPALLGTAEGQSRILSAYLAGTTGLYGQLSGIGWGKSDVANVLGLDISQARSLHNIFGSSSADSIWSMIQSYTPDNSNATLANQVTDQYMSVEERIDNWLSKIYSALASVQETTGIGWSDAAAFFSLILSAYGISKGAGALGSLMQGLGGAGGASLGRLGSLLGGAGGGISLAGLGTAAGALAIGGTGIYGLVSGISDFRNGDTGAGIASTVGGGAAIGGTIAALAGAGPVGWIIGGIGAVTVLTTKLIQGLSKEFTRSKGAIEIVEDRINSISESLTTESLERSKSIGSLKLQVSQASSLEEALQLVANSGLVNLNDQTFNTTEELLNFLGGLQLSTAALSVFQQSLLDNIKDVVGEEAKQQDIDVASDIYKAVSGYMGDKGYLGKDDSQYLLVKTAFESMAESITDEKERKKAIESVAAMFKDDELSLSELLTFTGGDLRGAQESGNSFKLLGTAFMSAFSPLYYTKDIEAFNAAASMLPDFSTYYNLKDIETANTLLQYQQAWQSAITSGNSSKAGEIAQSWKAAYDTLQSDSVKLLFLSTGKEMSVLADGTNYVPRDQIAFIHEGEAVVPKKYNPSANKTELESLREQDSRQREEMREENRQTINLLSQTATVLGEIKEFITRWKSDNERAELIKSMESNNANQQLVSGYFGGRVY